MIKFIVAAIWISAVTIGSVFYAFQSSSAAKPTVEGEPAFFGGLDYVKTEALSVPLLKNGAVDGYFLARFVYTVEPKTMQKLSVPAETLITDQLYTYLFANPQIDFSQTEKLDIDALRNGIRDTINARVGDTLIHEVLVEQVDYLSKADIRDNTIRRRVSAGEQGAKPAH